MKTILFLILFATCINFNACKSANSEDDNVTVFNSEQNKINKNDWVDFSKISVSKDSLDLVLFNLMLKYGNYPEDEFLKNIEILIKKGANPDTSIEYEYSVRKFGTYIPIVKHFYNNKYRHYKKSSTSFLKAVNTDNIKIVKKFIELGANVNKASKAGDYPLNIAISKNSEEIIDLLLKNGADISFADLSKNKNIDLIEKLVRLGANPQTININFAVNDEKLLKRLLNLHPDVNKYPLNYKTVFTNDNLLSLLIKNGLNDKAKGTFPDDCPPVYGAIKYGELKHIKILKNAGFNINKNCGGIKDDVLFLVIKMQKKDILNYYLNEMKTDPNVKNMAKESALIAAVDTDNVATITFDVQVNTDTASGTIISNQGFANGTGAGSGAFPEQPSDDPDTVAVDDPTDTIVSSLDFRKSVFNLTTGGDGATATPGDILSYRLEIVNTSTVALNDLNIVDELESLNPPDPLLFVPGTLPLTL
ncbi:MAG: ankyrin repeat domain-containing protein, partial [Bacteroidales bacterium]|nr:ankyrin repeat domain-containing protein [Bacteroidales bacterium]